MYLTIFFLRVFCNTHVIPHQQQSNYHKSPNFIIMFQNNISLYPIDRIFIWICLIKIQISETLIWEQKYTLQYY